MKTIPVYEPWLQKSYNKAVLQQLKSGWVGPGKTTEEAERLIAELTGKDFCAIVNSGTTALMLAIKALNIPLDKKILVPGYGYVAAANAASFLGYEIEPIDVENWNLCMSESLLEHRIGKDIGAVVYINHNGYAGEQYRKIAKICERYHVPMISDSAVAIGCRDAGEFGICGIYSFSVPKLVTAGQGGAIFTNNEQLYENILKLRDQGNNWRADRNHKDIGGNFRLPDLLSALLIPQLKNLHGLKLRRNQIWEWYGKGLDCNGRLVREYDGSGWCVLYSYPFADELIQQLKLDGIGASKFYKALYNNDAFAYMKGKFNLSISEAVEKRIVFLPSSLTLSKSDVNRVCKAVNKYAI